MVVAAVLVAAGIVSAVEYGRMGSGAQPAAGPDAPPQGVALLFVRDPGDAHALVAYDWSGARRGSVRLPAWVDMSRLRAAPDGSGFMVDPSYPGDYAAYFDRLGHTIFETDDETFASQAWAADDRRVCVVSGSGGGTVLAVRSPWLPDHAVPVAVPADLTGSQMTVAACSPTGDTALLQVPTVAGDWHLLRVRLSTGALLGQVDTGGSPAAVSHDGAYLTNGASAIYRAGDLSRSVAELGFGVQPFAFSGDDSLLLAATGPASLEVVEWKSGKVVWRYQGSSSQRFGAWQAQPSGREFAVGVGADTGPENVIVARSSGQTATLQGYPLVGA